MVPALRLLLLLSVSSGGAVADLPTKAPLSKYTNLWANSPFTSKPATGGVAEANPLENYVLAGVSPISGGHRVTLLNKQQPDKRIIVDTDKPKDGFTILAVTRKAGNPLGTVVSMSSGTVKGTVAFDTALLTLAPPPAATPPVQTKPQPQATAPPGTPNNQVKAAPAPRPRVIAPTQPTQPNQSGQPAGPRNRPPMVRPGGGRVPPIAPR